MTATARARDPAWLQRARELIETQHEGSLTVSQLAHAAGVSRVHLTRAFSAAYGLPPRAHLNVVRLRHAAAMLAAGVPIAQAALHAGFSDQSHFTRRFKRVYGLTPGAWRREQAASRG